MRLVFYTADEINGARDHCLPRLRELAAEGRRRNPIPLRSELSAKDRCRLRLYKEKMLAFKPRSPFRQSCIGILHSDVVGFLAARKVFGPYLDCLVLLTGDELAAWHKTGDQIVDGWYWYFGWKIHTTVPQLLSPLLSGYPAPDGFEYWVFTSTIGTGARHELWRYDGRNATVVEPRFAGVACEHGPIEEWYDGVSVP